MAYVKQTWNNGAAGSTPISAARLAHMEDGIENPVDSIPDGTYAGNDGAVPGTAVMVRNERLSLKDSRVNAPTDGTSALAALNAAKVLLGANGGEVFAPPGEYTLLAGETWDFPVTGGKGVSLVGAGKRSTRFRKIGAGNAFSLVDPASGIDGLGITNAHLADFALIGDATSGDGIATSYAYHSAFERLEVSGFGGDGISVRRGFYNSVRDVWSHHNVGNGLLLGSESNATMVFGGHYSNNDASGIQATDESSVTPRTHGYSIIGATLESNDLYGVYLYGTFEGRVIGCYFEESLAVDPSLASVMIDAPAAPVVSQLHYIAGNNFSSARKSIVLGRTDRVVIGEGNSINAGIELGALSDETVITPQARIDLGITDGGTNTRDLHTIQTNLVTTNTAQTITGLKMIQPSASNAVALLIRGLLGQSNSLFQMQDSNGNLLVDVSAAGALAAIMPTTGTRKTLDCGTDDSGGVGYRMVRVPN